MIPAMEANETAMRQAAMAGFSTATDLADYLVRAGVAVRDAHEVVGKAVAHCVAADCDLAELSLETLQSFHSDIREDVFQVLTLDGSVAARDHFGGTAPTQVKVAAQAAHALITSR
jgi:argininosuccinate lyase